MAVSPRWSACLSALALVSLLALSGCGDSRREQVAAYLDQVNSVQQRAVPQLDRANDLYARYARGQIEAGAMRGGLVRAQRSVASLRVRLDRIVPPREARRLKRLILDYYERGTGLARETAQLGIYLPAAEAALRPLDGISRQLRQRLAAAPRPAAQASALAAYERGLRRVVRALHRLDPPPVLRSAHRAQVERLTLATVLASRLGRAIERRDAQAAARLVARVRRLHALQPAPALSRQAVRAYNRRRARLTAAAGAVSREWRRLQSSFQ